MRKKIAFCTLVVVACIAMAFALTQGPNGPGTGANNAATGVNAWTSPGNVTANDNNGAAASVSSLATPTQNLQATNFGFTIPAGATIQGITVAINKGSTNSFARDNSIKLMKAGAAVGTEHADTATFWSTITACPGVATGFVFATYGSGADLWGTTWAASDINASNFGVQISAQNSSFTTDTACVDFVRVTVAYLPPPGGLGKRRYFESRELPLLRNAAVGSSF